MIGQGRLTRATQLAALARPGEVLASRTVKDLVVGSGISFTDRGTHQLPHSADPWPVFAVSDAALGLTPG